MKPAEKVFHHYHEYGKWYCTRYGEVFAIAESESEAELLCMIYSELKQVYPILDTPPPPLFLKEEGESGVQLILAYASINMTKNLVKIRR